MPGSGHFESQIQIWKKSRPDPLLWQVLHTVDSDNNTKQKICGYTHNQ
jgi:hypothetical protein